VSETATLILAAGRSARMGADKALLAYRSTTFVQYLAGLYGALGPVFVATNPELAQRMEPLAMDANPVVNSNPELGLFSSVRLGVRELDSPVSRLLVMPVDCILPDDTVPRRLLDSAADAPKFDVHVPIHGKKRGHPVLLTQTLFRSLLSFPPESVFSAVLERFRVVEVEVDEPWIHLNMNTPDDYERFLDMDRERRRSR